MSENQKLLLNKDKRIFAYSLTNFLFLVLVIGSIFYWYELADLREQKAVLVTRQQDQLELVSSHIQSHLEEAAVDTLFLKQIYSLKQYIGDSSEENKLIMELDFLQFLIQKEKYDQVRLLDLEGNELVRVNYNQGDFEIVADEDLQDKSDRYYLQDAKSLELGQIQVSHLDLNMENDEVQTPEKPMIRFVTPALNSNGEISGYLVLNYCAQHILDEVKEGNDSIDQLQFMIFNKDGYWLSHPDDLYEFAFMYGNDDETVFEIDPGLAALIFESEEAQFTYAGRLYAQSTIHVHEVVNQSLANREDIYWKLVSHFDESNFSFFNFLLRPRSIKIIVIFTVVLGIVSVLFGIIRYNRKLSDFRASFAFGIIDNAKEAVIITDRNTNIIYANDSHFAITGYTEPEILGKRPSNFKSGKHDRYFYQKMWSAIHKRGWWSGEIWDRKKDGEFYLKHLSIRSVETKTNEVYYIGYFDDISSVYEIGERYEKLRTIDEDTDLPNHIKLRERIDELIMEEQTHSLVIIKLKNYVELVNSMGEEKVSFLIRKVSIMINEFVSAHNGELYRTDKDEFAVLTLLGMGQLQLQCFSEIYTIFTKPIIDNDYSTHFTAACGATAVDNFEETSDFHIQCARIAVFKAVRTNDGQFVQFTEKLREYYNRILQIRMNLQSALDNDEFILYYQPQVRISDGKLAGVEALLRWESEELGFVSPDEFINIAEQNDMIVNIGNWVIDRVCQQKQKWDAAGLNGFSIALNASPNHFMHADLFEELNSTLNKYGIQGEEIEIEVTEEMLIQDRDLIVRQLEKIRALGIRVALDDFGTGYSSLQYIKSLPIDKLKIDRSFIKDIPESDDGTIAAMAIDLAKRLHLTTIAEGVETEAQREFVREAGCDVIQGFYYSKPLKAEEFILWYLENERVNALA